MAGRVTAVGPLVVRAGRWALPDGRRGALRDSAALTAIELGAAVALVLDDSPGRPVNLPAGGLVEVTGQEGGGEPWRYRVTTPGAGPVTVVLVPLDEGGKAGPWAGLSGAELVDALRVLHELLGVPWQHSVGRTAEHLILSTHPRVKGGTALDRAPVIPEPIRSARVEQPWSAWQRPLAAVEQGSAWLHIFDGNAAFLGAWRTDLGMGAPEHVDAAGAQGRTRRPGVWLVELPAGWHDGHGLPPIAPALTRTDAGTRAGWVTTPTLGRLNEHAREQGWAEVEPEEGWVWPRGPRFLSAAADRLGKARASAHEVEQAARAVLDRPDVTEGQVDEALRRLVVAETVELAVKDLYRVTVGRLSSRHEYVAEGWRRPDWANHLRAAYRTSLHRKLARWALPPIAVMTDAVAYVSDEPDPVVFAHQLGMRLGHAVGTMKHAGTCPLPEVDELLGRGPRELRDLFDRAARWSPAVETLRSQS